MLHGRRISAALPTRVISFSFLFLAILFAVAGGHSAEHLLLLLVVVVTMKIK